MPDYSEPPRQRFGLIGSAAIMGFEAITNSDDGSAVNPGDQSEWASWVSASRTRNFALADPIMDWLDAWGSELGFTRDTKLPGYDPRTDFTQLVFRQGRLFEESVVAHLRTRVPVLTVATDWEDIQSLTKAEETFAAMVAGVPVLHQAVLRNPDRRSYGAVDLLVRSDVLSGLFPNSLDDTDALLPAPGLGTRWHYRAVDIKFTTLHLLASGDLGNAGSAPAYKVQLWLYNEALGRLQGFTPPTAFLLGRGWEQTVAGITSRGVSCTERLAAVAHGGDVARGVSIADLACQAIAWVRRVREMGSGWRVIPEPSVPELYPNMTNQQDSPWRATKREIADSLGELTLLWQVGMRGRQQGHSLGVTNWRDARCTAAAVGVSGDKRSGTLDAILDVNQHEDGPPVRPRRVHAAEDQWRPVPELEFYVDFETVSDLADDFSRIPLRGGQPLIFMIGCGHFENGTWCFRAFTADRIDEDSEAHIIDSWIAHMSMVRTRLSAAVEPLIFHWSAAEVSNYETAYNSARARHPDRSWPTLKWFDFLQRVARDEPVVIRGAMGFGLKTIAGALYDLGLITIQWRDGPVDGLGAMVGAWWCHQEAQAHNCSMIETELMKQIAEYNEVDCHVLAEIVSYLRNSH